MTRIENDPIQSKELSFSQAPFIRRSIDEMALREAAANAAFDVQDLKGKADGIGRSRKWRKQINTTPQASEGRLRP